jgi:hypothetical protein
MSINLLVDPDRVLNPLTQVFARARHRLFHSFKEAWLVLSAAKKRLNH